MGACASDTKHQRGPPRSSSANSYTGIQRGKVESWGEQDMEAFATKLQKSLTPREVSLEDQELGDELVQHYLLPNLAQCRSLEELNLCNNDLGDETMEGLARALETNVSLKRLFVGRNKFSTAGFVALCRALHTNQTLQVLDVYGNRIGPSGGVAAGEMLAVNASLRLLDLYGAAVGDLGARAIFSALVQDNSTLVSLSLYGNGLGPSTADWMKDALERNHLALQRLNLKNNMLGEHGAVVIAEALRCNTTTRHLNLERNDIGPAGIEALEKAMAENKTVTGLDLFGNGVPRDAAAIEAIKAALKSNQMLLDVNDGTAIPESDNEDDNSEDDLDVASDTTAGPGQQPERQSPDREVPVQQHAYVGSGDIAEIADNAAADGMDMYSTYREFKLDDNRPDVPNLYESEPVKLLAGKNSCPGPLAEDGGNGVAQPLVFEVIRFSSLEIKQMIGEGNYGVTYMAVLGDRTVIVKVPKSQPGPSEWAEFSVFLRVPSHPHVVPFLGICVDFVLPGSPAPSPSADDADASGASGGSPAPLKRSPSSSTTIALVMEYIEKGDLADAIRQEKFSEVSSEKLLLIATDIAQGLRHLHSVGVVHRDVAARNVLIDSNDRMRIADFGLSRINPESLADERSEYVMTHPGSLPIRWLAPESLSRSVFSPQSDVWSFGVCLYEIATGCTSLPYPELDNTTVIAQVASGALRPEFTKATAPGVPDDLVELVNSCFAYSPRDRPTMREVVERLVAMYGAVTGKEYEM